MEKVSPHEGSCFAHPWMYLWKDMLSKVSALGNAFASSEEKSLSAQKLQDDIRDLSLWMEDSKQKERIEKADKQWKEMSSQNHPSFELACKVLDYYEDLWKLVQQNQADSIDSAYRCIDFVREFPQRIAWDMGTIEKTWTKERMQFGT